MARGVQLQTLLADLRAEIGASTSTTAAPSYADNLKTLLRRTQETLYDEHAWDFLRVVKTISITPAGTRYFDPPAGLSVERVEEVTVLYGGVFEPVERGIGFEQYSIFDPYQDERAAPIVRWDLKYTGSGEQIEIWPLPPDGSQTLYLQGIQDLSALTDDTDTAMLDDRLIILYAAAEELTRQESPDAAAKLLAARERKDTLLARYASNRRTIQMGLGRQGQMRGRRAVVYVTSS